MNKKKDKKNNLIILAVLFVLAWATTIVLFVCLVGYKNQVASLKTLLVLNKDSGNKYQKQDEKVQSLRLEENRRAERSLEFLTWKTLMQEQLKDTQEKLAKSAAGIKDLKSKPELANVLYYTLGLVNTAAMDTSAAKAYFTEALKYNARDEQSLYNLGFLYSFSDDRLDRDKALFYYQKYLEVAPDGAHSGHARQSMIDLTKNKTLSQ